MSNAEDGGTAHTSQAGGSDDQQAPIRITPSQYATQLAQLFLCGTSGWAVSRTSYDDNPIAFGAFTFLLGHGLLGILKVTMNDANKKKIGSFYDYSEFLSTILPLPLMNTQIYFNYHHQDVISYGHAASSIFPAVFNMCTKKWNIEGQSDSKTAIVKLVSLSNIGSLGYIGLVNDNYWAIGLSVLSLINELTLDYLEERYSAPKGDYNAVALAFFNIFAVNALTTV